MTEISKLAVEDFRIPSSTAGIELFVRNKKPVDLTRYSPERTLLFVHGATYPASTSFDLQLDGQSWMDYIASKGYDVYLLDLRGYGRSTKPEEMAVAATLNPPVVRGDVAISDLGAAVEFILSRRKIGQVCLLGWSWGTTLTATYASLNPDKVSRLVLYAPLWLRKPDETTAAVAATAPLPAYRVVRKDDALKRWLAGVPADAQPSLIPAGWFDKWADATWATDAERIHRDPPELRAPNGVVQDVLEYNYVGRPYYDPSKIIAPTLLIAPEWDSDTPPYMADALFNELTHAASKRHVKPLRGTHTMIMENNRMALFEAVQSFLDDSSLT